MMNRTTYELAVNLLGIPGTVTHTKTGATQSVSRIGIANARSVGDVNIVNAYGINARILTFLQSSLPFEPEKFDVVEVTGERLVLDAVIPVHEPGSGVIIGFRGFVRGK